MSPVDEMDKLLSINFGFRIDGTSGSSQSDYIKEL